MLYSAPFTLVGKLLWLRATDAAVALFEDYRHVATHARSRRPGQRVSVREHLPPEAQAFFGRDRAWCATQAERVGPACVALIQQLLSDHILERLRAAQGVLCGLAQALWPGAAGGGLRSGGGARLTVIVRPRPSLTNPLPWAIVLGCLTAATGFELWLPARNTVGMLADGASPVALFTIGAVLARPQKAAATGGTGGGFGDVPLVVFYKLIVHPALVLGIGKLAQAIGVPLDGFSLTVLVLIAALPSASSIPMLAERFGADAGRIARIVLFATAASFVSFSAAVALLL